MTAALTVMYWVAGVVVLAEALNKLQRTAPHAPGLTPKQRVIDALKALAWLLLAVSAGGAVAIPVLHLKPPGLDHVCGMLGFAVLIVRTRVKEG